MGQREKEERKEIGWKKGNKRKDRGNGGELGGKGRVGEGGKRGGGEKGVRRKEGEEVEHFKEKG